MADIDIQRKTTPVWPWILGIIIVVAIILFLVAGRDRDQLQNYGGGADEQQAPVPGQTVNPPSPANPDAPNRPDGRNPQVAPATPDQAGDQATPPAQPAPSESTIDQGTKPGDGASLELKPTDTVFTTQLAQQDRQVTTPGVKPANEDIIIIEDDLPEDALVTDESYPAEVTQFSEYLIQNAGTQADQANTYTADGLRHISKAIYVLSEQTDADTAARDQTRDNLDQIADQIATVPDDKQQAKLTAIGFEQAADWIYQVSETLYPTTESKAQAVQDAADNFDPEGQLSNQLAAVRAYFDRADATLQEMAAS